MINVWLGTTAESKTWLSLPTACFRHKCGFLISWLFVMNDLFHFSPPPIITKLLYSAFKKKKSFHFSPRTFFFFSYLFPLLSFWQSEMLGHCSNCIHCLVACRIVCGGGWADGWFKGCSKHTFSCQRGFSFTEKHCLTPTLFFWLVRVGLFFLFHWDGVATGRRKCHKTVI